MCLCSRDLPEELELKLDVVKSIKSVPIKEVNYLAVYLGFLVLIAVFALIQEYFQLGNFFTLVILCFIPLVSMYDFMLSRRRKIVDDKVEGILATVGCTMVSGGFILFKDTGEIVRLEVLCEMISSRKPY